jgi:HEAT repeat protein
MLADVDAGAFGSVTELPSPPSREYTEIALHEASKAASMEPSADVTSRLASLESLSGLSDEASIGQMAKALDTDPDPRVRALAASMLAALPEDKAMPRLVAGLGDADADIRIQIGRAMAGYGSDDAVLILGQQAIGDPEARVREAARDSLRSVGTEMTVHFTRDP